MELQIGSTIGDYQVVGILGAGGMGKVFKVRNTISDRVEAMKILLPDLANAPELADRFLREIKVQASLEHPNIASLHTAVRVENQLLMLMEFVDGVTLEQKLKEGPLPTAQAVDYIQQVLSALDYAHARGVVHRDIKPANMMLTPGGVIKLMDFGIAKASGDHKLTMTGTTMGSLYYMSPEQIQGAANLDARADLYSVGVSLYELVTGKRPFDGDSQFAIMSAHLEKSPVPPVQLDPRLPQVLNDVILMSVMKDPATRFQSAGAFRNALGNVGAMPRPAAVSTTAAAAAPQDFHLIEPTAPAKGKSKRGLWMAIGALAAVGVAVAVIQFAPWKGSKAATGTVAAPPAAASSVPAATSPAPAVTPDTASVPQATPAVTPSAPPPAAPAAQPLAGRPANNSPVNPRPQSKQPKQQAQLPLQPASQAPNTSPQAPPQAPAQSPQQAAAPAQPDPVIAARRAELMDAREKLAILDNRAQGIRGTLSRMERSQAASGYGLGSQYTGPAGLMDSYLRGASDALNAGDVAAARRFLEKAEPPMSALEKLLNK
jgi:eukaryotic-like serine/threonine-protein kinase